MYSLKLAVLLGLGKGMDRLPDIQVSIVRILFYYHICMPPEVIIEKMPNKDAEIVMNKDVQHTHHLPEKLV